MRGIILSTGPELNLDFGYFILKIGGNIVDAVIGTLLTSPYFATGSGVVLIRGPGIGNLSIYLPGFFPGMGIDRRLRYELWKNLKIEFAPTSALIGIVHILERWGNLSRNKLIKELKSLDLKHYPYIERLLLRGVDIFYRGELSEKLISTVAPYCGGLVTKRDLSLVSIKEENLSHKNFTKFNFTVFYPSQRYFEPPNDKLAYIFISGYDNSKIHILLLLEFGLLPWRKFEIFEGVYGNWLLSTKPKMAVGKPLKNHFWGGFWLNEEKGYEGGIVFSSYSKSLLNSFPIFIQGKKRAVINYTIKNEKEYINNSIKEVTLKEISS